MAAQSSKIDYTANYTEMARRDAVASQPVNISDMPPLETDFRFEYAIPNQNYVVVSFATPWLTPITTPAHTGLKICGAFRTQAEAVAFCKTELNVMEESAAVSSAREWHIVPASAEQTADVLRSKQQHMLAEYTRKFDKNLEDFDERKQRVMDGVEPGGLDYESARVALAEGTDDTRAASYPTARTENAGPPPQRHMRSLEVRGQTYAVVSFILDHDMEGGCNQFLFKIHGLFETDPEANAYMVNTASKVETTVDMYIIPCYEWAVPSKLTACDRAGKVYYRNTELNGLMNKALDNKVQVSNYMNQCTGDGQTPSVTEVGPDAVRPAVPAVEFGVAE